MAQVQTLVLDVPEAPEDQSQEPSPYDEDEVHDSFQQLLQEQGQWAADEGLELQPRRTSDGAEETSQGPEDSSGYSAATLRILASMPSRTIGRSRGAVISQYYNRTIKLQRTRRPRLRGLDRSTRPSLRSYDLELDPAAREEEEKRLLLAQELQGLAPTQRAQMLRAMPLSLAEKRRLWEESWTSPGKPHTRPSPCSLSCCDPVCDACTLASPELWCRRALTPWRSPLKRIAGHFGSGALSYFVFLKTLLLLNSLLLLPLGFLVALQAACPPPAPLVRPRFTGLELLTGGGSFTHSLMYYGYYSNSSLSQSCTRPMNHSRTSLDLGTLPPNMPLVYLLSVGTTFLLTCIILVYSMSRSFGESYRVGSTLGVHALTAFCSWDHKVTQKWACQLQQDNIRTHLKELLAETRLRHGPHGVCRRLRRLLIQGLIWLLCVGVIMGCTVAIYTFSEFMLKSLSHVSTMSAQQEWRLLALPLVVCLFNLAAPYLFRGLAALELQESPVLEVFVAICRNLILKMVTLGILCYHWLGRRVEALQDQCWEDFVGQELYRLAVMDFIFTLLDTLFGELAWRLVSEKHLKEGGKPEFDIARNVLELIYGQTLIWLGVLFSPLLPVLQIVKLLLLFYIKKASLMANCRAPRRPWLASHMSTVFLSLLCFPAFLGAAVFLCFAVWQVKPSSTCGPFRNLNTMYEAGTAWVRHLEAAGPGVSWLPWLHHHLVEDPFPTYLLSALLLAVIYLNIQVVKGQRTVISLLKEQISNEGEDKIFLINKIHSIYKRKERCRSEAAEMPPAAAREDLDSW